MIRRSFMKDVLGSILGTVGMLYGWSPSSTIRDNPVLWVVTKVDYPQRSFELTSFEQFNKLLAERMDVIADYIDDDLELVPLERIA